MDNIDKNTLAKALTEAAEAHHQYEQELGHRDEKWAEWYAEYIKHRIE